MQSQNKSLLFPVHAELQIIDSRGAGVDFKLESLKNLFDKKEYKNQCPKNKCTNLPVGSFAYEAIVLPWSVRVSGEITLLPQSNLVTLSMRNGDWGNATRVWAVIRGRIKGLKAPANAWIRIRSVFGEGTVDQKIEPDGSFRLEDCQLGKSTLTILQNHLIAYEAFIDISGGDEPLEIVIK